MMICTVCTEMLRDGRGYEFRGRFIPTFAHHRSTTTLSQSAEFGCQICMGLVRAVQSLNTDVNKDGIDLKKDEPISMTAILEIVGGGHGPDSRVSYRLSFYLEKQPLRIFLLDEIGPSGVFGGREMLMGLDPTYRPKTFSSTDTSSDEVFSTAQSWMKQCTCAKAWDEPSEKWYPRRLLDLQELRDAKGDVSQVRIRLVESDDVLHLHTKGGVSHDALPGNANTRYVSLSHCWGKPKPGKDPLRFTFQTEQRFKQHGILLRELPKNFHDAVVFASRMEKVGYIWIDSLCIRQPLYGPGFNKQEQLQDWFEQSRYMGNVYVCAYLNISATASQDSDGGLFYPRRPEHLVGSEVTVDYYKTDPTHRVENERRERRRCIVSDPSTWTDLVDLAPINKRGWVFQERLLAPRVLHFCHNQIAWECGEFRAAESLPESHSSLGVLDDRVVKVGRLKSLTLENGRALRDVRLRGVEDPDQALKDLYVFELWKYVVEVYSRTQLTQPSDELIALGGVARMFKEELFDPESRCEYVAGLWSTHLESQLLWYVNEVFSNGMCHNPAQRPEEKRAPSFSWATVSTSYGVTYGDVTDYAGPHASGPFFRVLGYDITYADPKNPFGVVKDGKLLIQPRYLRRIEVLRTNQPSVPYAWRLKLGPGAGVAKTEKNVYLDAPDSDADIFAQDAELYCMPAAYGERTEPVPEYLYCLLLKYESPVHFATKNNGAVPTVYRGFRRIGLAKLRSRIDDEEQLPVMERVFGEVICLC